MLKDTFTKEPITNEALPFLDLLIDENDAEHHKLLEISYVETLYPREINVYNKNARARVNFDFFGWKALRTNRDILLSGNIEHKPDEPLLADTSVSAFPKTISKNTKDYRKSFSAIEQAIKLAEEEGYKPRENWYVIMAANINELKAEIGEEKALLQQIDIYEILVNLYPKKQYFIQLGGSYGQLGRERDYMITLKAAYLKDFLNKESEYLALAQLLLLNKNPYWAAEVF